MNNLTGHEKLKRDCVAYFRQNEIWQRIFTGFREKYSSYGRFSGKVTVKNISGDGHTGRSAGRVFWKSADWKGRGKGI